ncbi:MAG TPA: rod shape-determining protein MreC [Candidatus Paceibacterota bacterium]|nr:rod shape-determining protein MreC [Candidatus Paceibacterota bacterium]
MKTQYFRRPKSFLSPQQSIVAIGAGVIILILIVLRLALPGVFTALFTPLWNLGNFFTGQAHRTEDAATLEARVLALEAENETLRNENRALTENSDDETRGIVAGVVARPPLSPYDVLILGEGTDQGLYEGMQAFSKGIPVGTLESVSAGSARVALYSSSGRATEGWVGEARVPITLYGLGGGAFQADVPRESGVVEGDMVYIPGPGALPMGVVVAIESNASSPRSLVRIRPMANPFTMTSVSVVAAPSL